MTDTGGEHAGLVDRLSDRLVKALPPAFLLLVLMNIIFLGVASYVFQHNTEVRNTMITKIIEGCLTHDH
jgi:hypothetical protein